MSEQHAANPASLPGLQSSAIPKRCPACEARYPADFRVCPRDATPLQDAPEGEDPLVGSVLGDSYEILRVIGEGGMGRVYEAAHRRLRNKRFAVKVLHHELARQPEIVNRFQREAEAASALSHPNVVEVFDVNRTPDGRLYIVAELLEGEELGRHLERLGRLGLGPAIRIVRQLCHALAAAHARGIIHRDVKPENVFLIGAESAPSVKVLDFGISKLGDQKSTLTKTGVIMGTPAYMPPEQARGTHVDHRADIYAVGAILYRILTGSKPFEDLDPVSTLTAVMGKEPRRPSTLERSIPPGLELIIQKAMAKEPGERYGSLVELETALAGFAPEDSVALVPAAGSAPSTAAPALATATAHTIFDSSRRTPVTQPSESELAGSARSTLVLLGVLSAAWALTGTVDTLTSAVRWARGTQELSRTEVTLCIASAIALLMTPSAFFLRHLGQRVWPSTPRAVETAARLRRALLASVVAYGVMALGTHAIKTVIQRDIAGAAWPGFAVLAFLAAIGTAAAAWWAAGRTRR